MRKRYETGPRQVAISNLNEDVLAFIRELDAETQSREVAENKALGERDLLCASAEKRDIMILAQAPDPQYLRYLRNLFPKVPRVLVPTKTTDELSRDAVADPNLMSELAGRYSGRSQEFTSYSATPGWYNLVAAVVAQGQRVTTPESPKVEDQWTVNYYGSKNGLRQHLQAHPGAIPLSEGKVFTSLEEAAWLAASYVIKDGGVVIKTEKGHAGMGVLILDQKQLPTRMHDCAEALYKKLKSETYWSKFPIVVERRIAIDTSVGGGNPDVECLVHPNGRVQILYTCGMRVTPDGTFKGVEVSPTALPKSVVKKLRRTGRQLGKHYAHDGYIGYFDVDALAGPKNKLFLAESNVRRTGGTHVYHVLQALYGEKAPHVYALSNNLAPLPPNVQLTFADLEATLKPLLFTKEKQCGIVLTGANILKLGYWGYVALADSREAAIELESAAEARLTHALR